MTELIAVHKPFKNFICKTNFNMISDFYMAARKFLDNLKL